MLDKSVVYKNIIMKMPAEKVLSTVASQLPEGFRFRLFENGDELHWARIETSVLEFESREAALSYFTREFLPHPDQLENRCVFIVDPQGTPVATATAWFSEGPGEYRPILHWVSVEPERQGLGLGRAVVTRALSLFPSLHPMQDVFLHTQTWSHVAIGLYHSMGFNMTKNETFGSAQNDYEEAMQVLESFMKPELCEELRKTAV